MEQIKHPAARRRFRPVSGRKGAKGVILFITLIMLVILTISGVAMMQLMDAGISAAGNIAFRQASLRVADVGVEDARTWLLAQDAASQANLENNQANFYFAYFDSLFDPKTVDWSNTQCVDQDGDGTCDTFSGYTLHYVIHRMASASGACSAVAVAGCLFALNASSSGVAEGQSQSGGTGANQPNIKGTGGLVLYRVTVKVSGPKHNINYVQAFMY